MSADRFNLRKTLFILSVKAGNGRALRLTRRIENIYSAEGREDDLSILVTKHGSHAEEAAAAFAAQHGANALIYICGGDGSTSEVANAIAHTPAAMGVVPVGTANDFSRMLYEPKLRRSLDELMQRSLTPSIRPIDLIRINDVYSINIVSFGHDTTVLQSAYDTMQKLPWIGGVGYMIGVLRTLFADKKFPVDIEYTDTEGRRHRDHLDLITATICNGGFYGNGFNPAPEAKLDDGIIHLGLASEMPFRQFASLLMRYRKGTHLDSDKFMLKDAVSGRIIRRDGEMITANRDGIIFQADALDFAVVLGAVNFAFL
jgi:YegS/Rv2252/BmrU family lipid kinase